MTVQVAYEKIHDILKDLKSGKIIPKQTKVNFYGVITYISPSAGSKPIDLFKSSFIFTPMLLYLKKSAHL